MKLINADDFSRKFLGELIQLGMDITKFSASTLEIERMFKRMLEEQESASDRDHWIPFDAEETDHHLPEENQIIMVSDGESVWEDLFMLNNGESWLMVQKKIGKGMAWQPMLPVYKAKEK